jgi:hypothetical protein
MAIYSDFFEAAEAILTHVQQTGHTVECFDDPLQRLIGFRCTGEDCETWQVSLTTIKRIVTPDNEGHKALLFNLQTPKGRALLADSFSRGLSWDLPEPPPAA